MTSEGETKLLYIGIYCMEKIEIICSGKPNKQKGAIKTAHAGERWNVSSCPGMNRTCLNRNIF